MTALYSADYTTAVRAAMQIGAVTTQWTDAEIVNQLDRTLRHVSLVLPAELKSTAMVTAEDSYDIDISALTGWIRIVKVEYKVDQTPPEYRNFTTWGDVLTIDKETAPAAADEEVYIWYHGPHSVTVDSSTVPARLEGIIIEGVVAHCMCSWFHNGLDAIHGALARLTKAETAIDLMTAKIALGAAQVVTADTNLDTNYPKIDALITQIGDEITLLISDIAAARAAVAGNLAAAVAAAALIPSGVAGAITDATSDKKRGEYFINRVNVGGGVSDDWLQHARTELSVGNVYAQQAYAYIAADRVTMDKLNTAANELNAVSAINARIKAYDEYGNPYKHYGALASKYFEDAAAGLAEVQGNLQDVSSRLQIGNVIANYSRMADIKLEAWKRSLRNLAPYRILKQRAYAD